MQHGSPPQAVILPSASAGSFMAPMIILTTLFFMWGLLTSLNDVLVPHLKAVYSLSYMEAMLVQSCFFGAYLVASIPAGILIRRIGYQNGVIAGLAVAAGGCLLFYPAATQGFAIFLLALFTLACGITVLQVAANPFVTVMGKPETASRRLTLTQAFNALGTAIAPALGGMLILGGHAAESVNPAAMSAADALAYQSQQAQSVQLPYVALAVLLMLMAILFTFARLPKIADSATSANANASLLEHRHVVLGAIGIFLYVGAEVSIGSFLINFLGEPGVGGLPLAEAAHYVSYYWAGALIGRFAGYFAMRHIAPGKAIATCAVGAMLLILLAISARGSLAMWSMIAVGLCNAIMFPVIFSMAVHRLGSLTGRASGLLCMAIVGGAFIPLMQGAMADAMGLHLSFLVPAACYAYILYFGLRFSRQSGSGD